jgi:Xaa-Pro aminopeptidase
VRELSVGRPRQAGRAASAARAWVGRPWHAGRAASALAGVGRTAAAGGGAAPALAGVDRPGRGTRAAPPRPRGPGGEGGTVAGVPDDVLIDADTIRSPELRHEIPASVLDPFLYGERDGVPFAAVSALDAATITSARAEVQQLDVMTDLGLRELLTAGATRAEALLEVRLRACREMGVTRAAVPPSFPLATAEHLRAGGVELFVDRERFAARRRNKTAAELRGVWRATKAAEAGLKAAAQALREAETRDGILHADGKPLTVERVVDIVRAAVESNGAALGDFTVSCGPQTATGHGSGSGPIAEGEVVIVDVWPQDRESACFSDIARTFVAGTPDPEIARWHALVVEAHSRAIASVRPGVSGRDLWSAACDFFEAEGFPTQRKPGATVMEGFPTALGHGVGLEVHEDPGLGRTGTEILAGDVITIEPYLCRPDLGGVQVEDILLVTADGAEAISSLPTSLDPRDYA